MNLLMFLREYSNIIQILAHQSLSLHHHLHLGHIPPQFSIWLLLRMKKIINNSKRSSRQCNWRAGGQGPHSVKNNYGRGRSGQRERKWMNINLVYWRKHSVRINILVKNKKNGWWKPHNWMRTKSLLVFPFIFIQLNSILKDLVLQSTCPFST